MIWGACSITSCQSSRLLSSTRSGFCSTRSRKSGAERIGVIEQVGAELVDVGRPARRVTHRVQEQLEAVEPERAVEAVGERDDFDVDVGIVDAERFDADLPVLAVPPLLRSLVAEVRRQVPHLPRDRRLVLHEGAHDRRGALRPQREPATALVLELVHLLAHDVGGLTDPLEHLEVLEDRRDDEIEPEARGALGEGRDQRHPTIGLRRQHVAGARGRAEP